MSKIITINGRKVRLKSGHGSGMKVSGRKIVIKHRIERGHEEIEELKNKIKSLEKRVEEKSRRLPVKIEMRKDEQKNEISQDEVRNLIKEELSFMSPKEQPVQAQKRKIRVRLADMPLPAYPARTAQVFEKMPAETRPEEVKFADGIEIPDIVSERYDTDEAFDPSSLSMKYPLIPRNPKPGERVYSYAEIFFDKTAGEMIYKLHEPELNDRSRIFLDDIKDYIQEKIDVNFGHIKKEDAVGYIMNVFDKAIRFLRIKTDERTLDDIRYFVIRDFIGLEKIEPLLQDSQIEDISCDGIGIPIFVYHRNSKIGSIKTNVKFDDKEPLDSFINKLAERCGKSVSVAKPLLDGSLPDGSRIQATLGSDIARHGSNFTIRMFTEMPITPIDIIKTGMCDPKTMATIWFVVEYQSSILVSGGTATGKTSLLNAFSLFIKPQMKIVSIEDTAELRLPHSHWVPEVARVSISSGREVDMFELLRESLRQRPDYIIVGEVRGKEAYVLFQQMATGHAGFSTIHADTFQKLVDRLTTPPIELPPNLLENLDFIVFISRMKHGNKYKRRISSITEIIGIDDVRKTPIVNEIVKWNPRNDIFDIKGRSTVLKKISERSNMTPKDVQEEIKRRAQILGWMAKKNINDYRKVSSIINLYYLSPEFVMKKMGI
ncbi:MAG: type II/IV secretion system ATPase subunit [Candidatus Aenigmarchaeota archaeon]|nr:type II/IV secretion system ATPase subunit [Candidatus Aenigmarchaeota archaeon]